MQQTLSLTLPLKAWLEVFDMFILTATTHSTRACICNQCMLQFPNSADSLEVDWLQMRSIGFVKVTLRLKTAAPGTKNLTGSAGHCSLPSCRAPPGMTRQVGVPSTGLPMCSPQLNVRAPPIAPLTACSFVDTVSSSWLHRKVSYAKASFSRYSLRLVTCQNLSLCLRQHV